MINVVLEEAEDEVTAVGFYDGLRLVGFVINPTKIDMIPAGTTKVKVFFWNSLSGMKPVRKAVEIN